MGKLIEQILRKDELQHGVAEEFEPLIVEMMALRLVTEAGMGERFRQQQGVAKFVFEADAPILHLPSPEANAKSYAPRRPAAVSRAARPDHSPENHA